MKKVSSMVKLGGMFGGNLSRKDKMIIAVFVIMGIVIAAGIGLWTMTVKGPAAPQELNKVTVEGTPYFGQWSDYSNVEDKTISVDIMSKDGVVVRTMDLQYSSFTASTDGLELKDYFYIASSTSNYYFYMNDHNATTLSSGERVAKIDITQNQMTVGLTYMKTGSFTPNYAENETGLAGAGNTSFTVTQEHNFTALSGVRNLQFKFTVNNTTTLDVDSFTFDGSQYTIDSDNINRDSPTQGNYTVTVNITSEFGYFTNSLEDAKTYQLTFSGTADIFTNHTTSLKSWFRYTNEDKNTVTSSKLTSYFG